MRVPGPAGPEAYLLVSESVRGDGNTERGIVCLRISCDAHVESGAAWGFGVADRHTHVLALRAQLWRTCADKPNCPHFDAHAVVWEASAPITSKP